jgi:hypothetical protein
MNSVRYSYIDQPFTVVSWLRIGSNGNFCEHGETSEVH